MQLNTYLVFNGQCEAAFKFYEQVLGGKIAAMFTHAGTPAAEHVPPEWLNKIMHVRLKVGDSVLMGSDAPPDRYKTAERLFGEHRRRGPGGGGAHLSGIGGGRDGGDADPEDFLGRPLRYAGRSIRYSVDGELRREGEV